MVNVLLTTVEPGGDVTAPTFVSAETASATTVDVTLSETVTGTEDTANWAFDIDSVAATITGVSISGDTVTLTISETLVGGETLDALAYSGGDLADASANALADFSAKTINNTVGIAQITMLFVDDQRADGEVELTYSINESSGISWALTTTSTPLTAANLRAGTGAADSGTDTWTTAGADTVPAVSDGLAAGTYYLQVVVDNGGDSDVKVSNGFSLDTTAPAVSTATTDDAGDRVKITFNDDLQGTTTTSDWAVYDNGTPVTVHHVFKSGATVYIQLADALTSGNALTYDYSGTGLQDSVANVIPTITGGSLTDAIDSTYTANGVSMAGTQYLVASSLPSDAQALLFVVSATQTNIDTRLNFISTNGTDGAIYGNFNSVSGQCGIHVDMADTNGQVITQTDESVTSGTQYFAMVSVHTNGTDLIGKVVISDGTSWSTVIDVSDNPSASAVALNLATQALHLFARSDDQTHQYRGTVHRMGLWTKTDGSTPILDVTDPAKQALVASGASIVRPSELRADLTGVDMQFDIDGHADELNAGIIWGALETATVNGTFT